MENTLENKAKFFAQYWGHETRFGDDWISDLFNVDDRGDYIELRRIKQMTLEEGQLFLNNFFNKSDKCEVVNIVVLTEKAVTIEFRYPDNETPEDDEGYSYSSITIDAENTPYQYVDWWRFYGFAVSWMGLEVPRLVEYGWIKLKEN